MPALRPPALADQGNPAEVFLQGFVQFRVRGEPVHLDVDALNEQLQAAGKTRLRQFMRPDEALGVIISFDNVVCSMAGWSYDDFLHAGFAILLPLPAAPLAADQC